MFVLLVSLVISSLLVWVYIRWKKVSSYWKVRGVPHYPPHPLMGSLTFLQRENPSLWMRRAYKDFKSPYVGMWLFWRPALVVNSPELARRITVKDADVFRDRFLSSGKSDPIGALSLFLVNDPLWTSLRRRLTQVFTSAKLKSHAHITIAKSKDLVERIKRGNNNTPFKLRELCTDYSTDVIGESAFGISCESVKTGDSLMRKITREFSKFNLYRGLCWSSIFFFPELVDIFRFSLFPKDSVEVLRRIYRSIIEQRGGYDQEVKEIRDLLDVLRKIKHEAAAEGEEMSEDVLLSQAAIMLLGGYETTGTTISWSLYELAWHPECQEKLYKEISEAKEKLGDKDFDLTTLSQLPYLNCVIKEILRIYPPMGWLDRIASQDYKIDDNLTIPAGTPVYVNAVGMQVDPEYFPEPFAFNPDRFLPENEKNITPYTFMPFGEGPRNCIGKRFGFQSMLQGISSLILNFELKTLPNTPKPKDVTIEKNGLFYFPVDERMVLDFVPRHTD